MQLKKGISMKKIIITFVSAIGLLLPLVSPAQGTFYLSNLGISSTGSASIGSDSWLAESFQTGTNSNGYILNSIQLLMGDASGSPDNFTVLLYGDGSFPGHELGSFDGSTSPSTGGVFTYTISSITLSSSTIYFIVLTSGTSAAEGSFMQEYAADYNYSSSDDWILSTYRYSSVDGINWSRGGYSGDGLQFAVNATAVPEPSSYALGTLGALLLGFHRWRNSSR
jgi:hypothetical protein